jgi:hypothetical protein
MDSTFVTMQAPTRVGSSPAPEAVVNITKPNEAAMRHYIFVSRKNVDHP